MKKYKVVIDDGKKYYIDVSKYSFISFIKDFFKLEKAPKPTYIIEDKSFKRSNLNFRDYMFVGVGAGLLAVFILKFININITIFFVMIPITFLLLHLFYKNRNTKEEAEINNYKENGMIRRVNLKILVFDRKKFLYIIIVIPFSIIILIIMIYLTLTMKDYTYAYVFLSFAVFIMTSYKQILPGPIIAEYIEE